MYLPQLTLVTKITSELNRDASQDINRFGPDPAEREPSPTPPTAAGPPAPAVPAPNSDFSFYYSRRVQQASCTDPNAGQNGFRAKDSHLKFRGLSCEPRLHPAVPATRDRGCTAGLVACYPSAQSGDRGQRARAEAVCRRPAGVEPDFAAPAPPRNARAAARGPSKGPGSGTAALCSRPAVGRGSGIRHVTHSGRAGATKPATAEMTGASP